MLKKSIPYRMYILQKIRWQIGFTDSLLLYKSEILAFFYQGDIFFHTTTKEQLFGQTLQNKCLRTILNKKKIGKAQPGPQKMQSTICCRQKNMLLVKFASHIAENMRVEGRPNLRSNTRLLIKENPICNTQYVTPNMLNLIINTQAFKTRVKSELLQGKLNFPE